MKFRLGPTFSYIPPPPVAPAASGKPRVEIEIKGVVGNVLTVVIPPYDPAEFVKLLEVRAYIVPEGDPDIPLDADGYVASSYAFGHADVSGFQSGGEVPITLPDGGLVPHLGQLVLGDDE